MAIPDDVARERFGLGVTTFHGPLQAVFEEVHLEMTEARSKGWSEQHDDSHGSGHLVTEATYRLLHMGEFPTDDAVDHTLTVAIGLLVNAKLTLKRAREVRTFTVDGADHTHVPEEQPFVESYSDKVARIEAADRAAGVYGEEGYQ